MTLAAGSHLGPYEVLSPLGAGGMGEVYKARDTRLERTVAIKVLPSHLSSSTEVRQRFEREAKTISRLSHPHICALYDVGSQDGADYLVMEYLEGETLADRLSKGPLPLGETLRYASEIAGALESAHRAGIVHRDLKPGNVMLTKSGVKLLDFGLARLLEAKSAAVAPVSRLATQDAPLTTEGTILGTLQYMPPEQLEGKETDTRTDIFAFGTVLYEMATGRKAFSGISQASVISAILSSEPQPIASVQPASPPVLDRVVKICLAKNPEDRWQSARDAAIALSWATETLQASGVSAKRPARLPWLVAAVLALALAAVFFARIGGARRGAEPASVRFRIPMPPGATLYQFSGPTAVSPDGRSVAFITQFEGRYVLWVRALDALETRILPGTEDSSFPFWSPDSRFLGYFAREKLWKIAVAGGPPEFLCDAPSFVATGAWGRDGTILFGSLGGAVMRIGAAGGKPSPVTALDSGRRELMHLWPHFLPDGRHFLYLALSARPEENAIRVAALGSDESRRILAAVSNAAYSPPAGRSGPGNLLFSRGSTLLAVPFDAERLEILGDPVPVAESILSFALSGGGVFSVSNNGVLAYGTKGNQNTRLTWFDRQGRASSSIGSAAEHVHVDLSPDDKRVLFEKLDPDTRNGQIWLADLARDVTTRLSATSVWDIGPVWSSNGTRFAFGSARGSGTVDLYQRLATGSEDALLFQSDEPKSPTDWTPDGRSVVFWSNAFAARNPLHALKRLSLDDPGHPAPLIQSDAVLSQGKVSPDGRWLAYTSNESGRLEVYIRPFASAEGKWQVSSGGGSQARWRRDGKELFYLAADHKLMVVAVGGKDRFEAGAPQPLFQTRALSFFERYDYSVTADGQRFLVNTRVEEVEPSEIVVVTRWAAGRK